MSTIPAPADFVTSNNLAGLSTDPPGPEAVPIHVVTEAEWPRFFDSLEPRGRAWLAETGVKPGSNTVTAVPGEDGRACLAVLAIGADGGARAHGDLPLRLPTDRSYRLEQAPDRQAAILGYCLGAYRYEYFKPRAGKVPVLHAPDADAETLAVARATRMVRDLINHPANVLGPAELADAAAAVFERRGGSIEQVSGDALQQRFPLIAAVGGGSDRAPRAVIARWTPDVPGAPRVALVGKGVCFDTGGYDLKPSAGMSGMKKDMAGAAVALGVARVIMDLGLPVALSLRLGCVENSVSGRAMRPRDVVRSAAGPSVEIGDTDAEGRLVLADLLAEASAESPSVLLDWATLTGAARVALGPDLPALFSNDDVLAAALAESANSVQEPVWRLPLWRGYGSWLDSEVADFNNVSRRPQAGAITAALFLERFVDAGARWAHLDIYGANDKAAPGRPEGGEATGLRATVALVKNFVISTSD